MSRGQAINSYVKQLPKAQRVILRKKTVPQTNTQKLNRRVVVALSDR